MRYKLIHFIGIKGVAMTALAILAKEQGSKITGSDTAENFPTKDVLEKYKIKPFVGFKKENLTGKPDLVVVTGGHNGMNNPEAQAAREMGLKVLMHGEALAEFCQGKKTIAVAGSHGKTTVAAMIAHLLAFARFDPSYAVGCGQITSLGAPGHYGKGGYFVVEADEYVTDPSNDPTPRFFWLNPQISVITNIEFDHPDVYRDIKDVKEAFLTFGKKTAKDGLLVLGIDNENLRTIISSFDVPILTYGFSPIADYQINRVSFSQGHTKFWLKFKGQDLGQFSINLPGRFNILNSVASAVVANYLGIPWDKIKEALSGFAGTLRRFEFIKEKDGIKFFDDYAHHPDQIKSTLEGARAWFPDNKIICLFQPHTYSRTKALFKEFSRCFTSANEVIILDIYSSAREKVDPAISPQLLANEILKHQPNVHYLGTIEEATDFLKRKMTGGDIVITMGAGDIYKIHEKL